MDHNHKRAVAHLLTSRIDAQQLAVDLLAAHPLIFLELITGQHIWATVDPLIHQETGYIPAIKEYRAITGSGLKDAKDAVDGRKRQLGLAS